MSESQSFEIFLKSIDLDAYREKYSPIKLVELDLPSDIQAIPAIYRNYWEKTQDWPSFEDFYSDYEHEISADLENFRIDKQFSEETFKKGLPARIYRTWASIITQIQGGYICKEIYGDGNVEMSPVLDWQGIDFQIKKGNKFAYVQIKKITQNAGGMGGMTRSANQARQTQRKGKQISFVEYEIAPRRFTQVNRDITKAFLRWQARHKGKLRVLDNGFVIFEKATFVESGLWFQA